MSATTEDAYPYQSGTTKVTKAAGQLADWRFLSFSSGRVKTLGRSKMTDLSQFTGSDFPYKYQTLPEFCSEVEIGAYCSVTRARYADVAKAMDDAAFTQWTTRNYLALKFILGSTMLASSAKHCETENVRVVLPYLNYYSLLNCSRAFLMTVPDMMWKGQLSVELTHQNTINSTTNFLRRIDKDADSKWGQKLKRARDHRNLFSYRFPGKGISLIEEDLLTVDDMIDLSRFLAEMAHLNSECLEAASRKHHPGPLRIIQNDDYALTMTYESDEQAVVDGEDRLRMARYLRGLTAPLPLTIMATDGLLEDFFGAWCDTEGNAPFNPDDHWTLLMDFW